MKKFINEVEEIIKTSEEYRILGNPYRISASKFATDVENDLLKNLTLEKKNAVYRDISRMFDKEPEG